MHYPQLIEAPATFRVAVEHFAMACEEALSSYALCDDSVLVVLCVLCGYYLLPLEEEVRYDYIS